MPSSGRPGAPSLRAIKTSSGAPKEREISYPTGTPPRGRARTIGFSPRYRPSRSASRWPASRRSLKGVSSQRIYAPQPQARWLIRSAGHGFSTFYYDQGSQASHLLPYARPVRGADDLRGVLVGLRGFLVDGGPAGGAYQDALVLQLPLEVTALGRPFRRPAPHLAPGPVRAGAEGLAHGPFGAGQDEGVAAHVSRYQDRLAHRTVPLR